ncbi:AMP-binding protein [Xenorhabdus nematophila]|uniref:AMP-binding protein n=1 Tax=Xenorhabdus nematophila TaxID=628 RepID=UPI00056F86F9|nr:AMP-binding protein [Xenorhabdus nematophila]KHD28264.1 hypothetical protein LH67_11940 [Xenorhabdus nematophila]
MKNNIDSWQINTGLKILNDALISTLEEKPDAKALVHAEKVYSYYQLIFSADMLAKQFNEIGIVEGDRIALDAPRSSELFIAIVACLLSGISFISVPRAIEKKAKNEICCTNELCGAFFSF